jgi:hypothetical protein
MLLQGESSTLTHKVLSTLMAKFTAVKNARPLIPVSSHPESPLILTPAMLLTQKTGVPTPPPDKFGEVELHKQEWKQVQSLGDTFWNRWRRVYLCMLQSRLKWLDKRTDLKEGDVVLMKNSQAKRKEWPMAIVVKTLPSRDEMVRKVNVRVVKEETMKVFSLPISEVVLLLSSEDPNGQS